MLYKKKTLLLLQNTCETKNSIKEFLTHHSYCSTITMLIHVSIILALFKIWFVNAEFKIERCLTLFELQEYDYVSTGVSLKASKCIYKTWNFSSLVENCGDMNLILQDDNGQYSIMLKSEEHNADQVIFQRNLMFMDQPSKLLENISKNPINLAEKLIINISLCRSIPGPWQEIIFLPIRNDNNLIDYGFLFFVQTIQPKMPELIVLMGAVMVPFQNLKRSFVMDQSQYEKYLGKEQIYLKNIDMLVGCDLKEAWKNVCDSGSVVTPSISIELFLFFTIIRIFFFVCHKFILNKIIIKFKS